MTRLAIQYTPDGEVPVQVLDDGVVQLPLPTQPIQPLSKKFREKHKHAMYALQSAVDEVKRIGRQVPVLRTELIAMGVEKQLVKDLEDFGLVQSRMVGIINTDLNKKAGAKLIVYFTIQGRMWLEEFKNGQTISNQGVNGDSGDIQHTISEVDGEDRV